MATYEWPMVGSHCQKHLGSKSTGKLMWFHPLPQAVPRDAALLQAVMHLAQALRGLQAQRTAFKQPGFGNPGSQQEDSLLTWDVDPGAFQAWRFDFGLFLSKTIFSDDPTQCLLSGSSASPWAHMIWKTVPIAYRKETLPTCSLPTSLAVPSAISLSFVLLCWHQHCQRDQLAKETALVMWLAFCLLQLRSLLSTASLLVHLDRQPKTLSLGSTSQSHSVFAIELLHWPCSIPMIISIIIIFLASYLVFTSQPPELLKHLVSLCSVPKAPSSPVALSL